MASAKFINSLVRKARAFINMVPDEHKHFTFIIDKNKILSFGFNQTFKTAPLASKYGYRFNSIHSELHAIMRFPYRPAELRRCTMVNLRFRSDGSLGMSKPCSKCQKLINDFNLNEVWYSTNDGVFQRCN